MQVSPAVDWSAIDTVLLDMDGTLLDLHFDNWFWFTLIPTRYAAANGISAAEAQARLAPKFQQVTGTLSWYCIDHWTRELSLDIRALTRASIGQVNFLPGAVEFLERLQAGGRRVVLVTNAHPDLLDMKNERVALTRYFHACYSTHRFDAPKEHAAFWPRLSRREEFDPQRTLFVDDSLPVLECAQRFGIAHLRAVRCPDSKQPPKATDRFIAIDGVTELLEPVSAAAGLK
jgi:putative hydrolase of the HAD superfamily